MKHFLWAKPQLVWPHSQRDSNEAIREAASKLTETSLNFAHSQKLHCSLFPWLVARWRLNGANYRTVAHSLIAFRSPNKVRWPRYIPITATQAAARSFFSFLFRLLLYDFRTHLHVCYAFTCRWRLLGKQNTSLTLCHPTPKIMTDAHQHLKHLNWHHGQSSDF